MDNFEPVSEEEYQRLMQIMGNNVEKSFVQRVLNPGKFPTMDSGDGGKATHRMAWAKAGDKYYVFPTVLLEQGGVLKDYGDKAWDAVSKTGNYIAFDTAEEADWFSRRYKGAWAGQKNKPPR